MECLKALRLLNPFLEGELKEPQSKEMEDHLASCPACRGEMEDLRRSLALVEGLPRLSLPAGFTARVMSHIPRWRAAPQSRSLAVGWALTLALGLVGLFLLLISPGGSGWPWDTAGLEGLVGQPLGPEDFAFLLMGVEMWVVAGMTLMFVAFASLLVQLMGRELRSQNGHA